MLFPLIIAEGQAVSVCCFRFGVGHIKWAIGHLLLLLLLHLLPLKYVCMSVPMVAWLADWLVSLFVGWMLPQALMGKHFMTITVIRLPQTIITFHYENGGHIITWISHSNGSSFAVPLFSLRPTGSKVRV